MYTFISGLLLLLLLTASQHPVHTGQSEINYIHSIIKRAHQERPIETLVYVKRRQDFSCSLNEIKSVGLATLRMDERTMFSVKGLYNSQALALVCLSELADVLLLPNLAQNFDRMRDARIIILLRTTSSYLPDFLRLISEQANNYSFVNIIVLHSESKVNNPLVAYRLQPFPTPIFLRVGSIYDGPLFPKVKFNGKSALIFPDLVPPRSMLSVNPRTGEKVLCGSSDQLIMELAKRNNITLRLLQPLGNSEYRDSTDIYEFIKEGIVDLPIRGLMQSQNLSQNIEYTDIVEYSDVFIIVPCGNEIRTGDVFSGLRNYFRILLVSYFMFAVIETFIEFVTSSLIRRRPSNQYWNLVLNLRAFAGVLGLPMYLRRYRSRYSSISLQQITMLLCICGVVFTSFFNANLSTLLTKHPQDTEIKTFEQLRESKLDVIFDNIFLYSLQVSPHRKAFEKLIPNAKFIPTSQYIHQLFTLNSSCAYHMRTDIWKFLEKHQRSHNKIRLCRSDGLNLFSNVALRTVLKRNSVFRKAYRDFIHDARRYGLLEYWNRAAGLKMTSNLVSGLPKALEKDDVEFKPNPLNFTDFLWLWKSLGVCYAVAGLVFVAEICVAYWRKKLARREVIIREFVI